MEGRGGGGVKGGGLRCILVYLEVLKEKRVYHGNLLSLQYGFNSLSLHCNPH